MSWKEDDYSLSITTPYPFLRRIEVNFVINRGKTFIIAVGDWRMDIGLIPMVFIDGQGFVAERTDTEPALKLFLGKYGQFHLDKYFKGEIAAYSLSPGLIDYNVKSVVAKVFDDVAETYEQIIRENATQLHMRAISREILMKYYFAGAGILDLGAGVMLETGHLASTSKLTAVEGSFSLQELIRKQFEEGKPGKVDIYGSVQDLLEKGMEYDVIFSTFGYLELNNLKETLMEARKLLKPGGVFLAGFWNSKGLLDGLLSLVQGKKEYFLEKRNGMVPAGQSKYNLAAYAHRISDFKNVQGLKIREMRGICTIIPPYNYALSRRLSQRGLIRKLDNFLGKLPIVNNFSDHVIVVLTREGVSN